MLADLLREPGVEEIVELRSRVGFLALHGGNQDRRTEDIAVAAATGAGASLYAVVQPPDVRWHIPSHRYEPDQAPNLARFLEHVDTVISVHGYGTDGWWMDWRPPWFPESRLARFLEREAFLVGGCDRARATDLGQRLRTALPGYTVLDELDDIPAGGRGVHPKNPVNRARHGGVQLECPPKIRGLGPRAASGDLEPLVSVLADTARAWETQLDRAS